MDVTTARSPRVSGTGTAPTRIPAGPARSNVPARAQHQLDELLELGTHRGLKRHLSPAGGPGGTAPAMGSVAVPWGWCSITEDWPGLSVPPAPSWARPGLQHQGQGQDPATGSLENAELCFAQGVGLQLLFSLLSPRVQINPSVASQAAGSGLSSKEHQKRNPVRK